MGSVFRADLFTRKVAVVTGGGTGIGRAIAKELSMLGCNVVIASRKMERLEESAAQLNQGLDCARVHPFQCNIRKPDEVNSLMNYAVKELGGLHCLVNNGGGQFVSSFENISRKGWDAVVDTNLNGTFNCLQAAYKSWMKENGGSIINIVVCNRNGTPGIAHTGAARAGVENLTKTLALEWASKGIRINCVAPGTIYSETAAANYTQHVFEQAVKFIPMSRLGTVEELSSMVCFLLSPASAFTSGETIAVDGGQSLFGCTATIPLKMNHDKSEPYNWQNLTPPSKL